MGMFSRAVCASCNGEIGRFDPKHRIKNEEVICPRCYAMADMDGSIGRAKNLVNFSVDEVRELVKRGEIEADRVMAEHDQVVVESMAFNATKKIGDLLEVDESEQKWRIPVKTGLPKIHTFDEIVSFELLEEGETITKGGLGGAIAGGLLFGGTGAVVGSVIGKKQSKPMCNSMSIKIVLNNMSNPNEYIHVIDTPLKRSGFVFEVFFSQVQECLSVLQMICDNQNNKPAESNVSNADEIQKFKSLLDSGVITQDEFDMKKKQLLGL